MNVSGIWASVSIVMVLMLTPLTKLKPLRFISRYRRFVGLTACLYAFLHLFIYLVLFAGLSWSWISSDLVEKPYIYAGVLALLILLVLAVTSTKKMMKRLGRNWKPVHRFVYFAALAVIAHLWWQVKSDITIAMWFSVFLVPLLVLRLDQFSFLKKPSFKSKKSLR
ncbi:sulfite oxidase heme-binding subunit YedZ [Marinomonas transparens]|nr:ferric reductase-like transmembrane domain-containing protein [Marinomonas transparens]